MPNLAAFAQQAIEDPTIIVPRFRSYIDRHLLIKFRQSKICIVSFPKAGRTWLRVVLGKAIHSHYHISDPKLIFLSTELSRKARLPLIYITHDIAITPTYEHRPLTARDYASKRVILLVRDIRDLLVSYYHQNTDRFHHFYGSIADFVRNDEFGAARVATFYKMWHERQGKVKDFLLLRYEELHTDPHLSFGRAMAFIGISGLTKTEIDEALTFGSFGHMQKMELLGNFPALALQPISGMHENARKTRKGKIGSYREELTEHDLNYVEETVKQIGAPLDWLYYEPTE